LPALNPTRSPRRSFQRFVLVDGAVIQKLDMQFVFRPVETRGGGGNAQRQAAFIAHRKLHQHIGQHFVGKVRHPQPARRRGDAQRCQCRKLK
jgi:hypothetical protein